MTLASRGVRRAIVVALVGVFIAGGAIAGAQRLTPKRNVLRYITRPVAYGDISATVTETGTVNPVDTVQVGTQVSGTVANQNLAATKIRGRIVNVGRLGGTHADFNFDLHAARRINYIGVTFRTRSIEEIREIFDEVRKDIWPAVESRKLQLPIDKVFAFEDIGKAFEHMEANRHLGKIVVTL